MQDYYVRLGKQQREAYIARMVGKDLDLIAQDQMASLKHLGIAQALGIRFDSAFKATPSVPDRAGKDFITVGTVIASSYRFWGDNFDAWMKREGGEIEEKRAMLRKQADAMKEELDAARKRKAPPDDLGLLQDALEGLEFDLARDPDDLSYVGVASNLAVQAKGLEAKLKHLQEQLKVMQGFHGIVNDYLSIDATINAAAITEAAQKALEVSQGEEFPELKKLVGKGAP